MMGGLMLDLSNDLLTELETCTPKETIKLPSGVLELYSSKMADKLLDAGFLNFVVTDARNRRLGYPISDFQRHRIIVKGQEAMKKPNASCIMYVWIENDELCAQHWEGFISHLDVNNFDLIGQTFSK
jgi:hypothetical protein